MGVTANKEKAQTKRFRLWHVGLIAVFVLLGGRAALNFSGYCGPSNTWFSDQELIDAAVAYEMKEQRSLSKSLSIYIPRDFPLKGWKPGDPNPVFVYESIEHFHKINPDCCDITRLSNAEWNEIPNMRSITGYVLDILEIGIYGYLENRIFVRHKKYNEGYYSFTKSDVVMDSCLMVLERFGASRGYSSLKGAD